MDTIVTLRLEGWGEMGEALARHEGREVLVFGGITGEEVRAEVRHFRRHSAARVIEVVSPSPERVTPPCPYFGECTGCQWQHIRYEHQLELKRKLVREALAAEGLSVAVSPPVPAIDTFGYRNHARFTVRKGNLGFVNRLSRRFIRIDRCLLMHEGINRLLGELQGRCDTTQLSIRYGVNTGSWLIQPRLNLPLATGQKYYEESLLGRSFRISAGSFFQVNIAQAGRMVGLVRERLGLTGREVVVDAYAGVGTFAALLAPYARKVIAIEEAPSAVADAKAHAADLSNVEFVQAKTEEALGSLTETPDAVILDPPRAGCHPAVIAALNLHPPRKLIYVSCEPQSLARDLRVLSHGPFAVKEVLPVDLFPHTHHVECLATLACDEEKARAFQSRQQLILASASPRRQEILADMGISFKVVPSKAEEAPPASGEPVTVALEQAIRKARAVAATLSEGTVIGADTIVVEGKDILGKPSSAEEAVRFLQQLRNKAHHVITAVAVIDAATGEELSGSQTSKVYMRNYSDEEIAAYVATGSPRDKAGAYGIQDDFRPVEIVRGCYLNVVGLPVCTLLSLLYKLGVHPRVNPDWKPVGECKECEYWGKAGTNQ